MAARLRFSGDMRAGVAGGMGSGMRVRAAMHASMLANMDIHVVADRVRRTSGAVSEISQYRRYNKVDQPDQETANKHK